MFDYHLHSRLSHDSTESPENIVATAERLGLREICFTDHYDHASDPNGVHDLFSLDRYAEEFDRLRSDKVLLRRGVEYGLTEWNSPELDALASQREFDYIIGSVHNVGGWDPYYKEYWGTTDDPFGKYLEQTLACVKAHDNFDALGHINYVCKSAYNPTKKPLRYADYRDICDEIMKILAQRGRGMEINTSGCDRVGDFLPSADYLRRFRELGGEIVTVGSDAHDVSRLGQYTAEAAKLACEIFGYVCTFEKRKPIFHKL